MRGNFKGFFLFDSPLPSPLPQGEGVYRLNLTALIRTRFAQSNQQEARMSARLKMSSVREIQVLRNKESAFLLGRNPDIGIRLAG